MLSEREILEIKVWKTLLIYATIYNIAEKVEKQLQKLSPEFLENVDVDLNTFHTSVLYSDIFSNKFSSKLLDSYSSSVESSSGGGGGYTSTGGGGDSFGGGDGGGTR